MKTNMFRSIPLIMALMAALTISLNGCSKESEATSIPSASATKEALLNYTQPEPEVITQAVCTTQMEELSEAEREALLLMREEEFLAHDVYLAFSQLYSKPVFRNITKSEAVHTEAIRRLLVRYNIPDPAANHVTGVFTNPNLQALYTTLVAQGTASLLDACIVGATIEDLDIYDLQELLKTVDNHDITLVFNNLINGSKNHLRAFYANILFLGGTYTPQYISQEEFNSIINP